MSTDPREVIAHAPMSRAQILACLVTVGLNALDGFDALAISFASPGIASEWGIDRAALGILLTMETVGMAIGSIFLGGIADRFGRRPMMLGCLVVMATGMILAANARGIYDLSAWRILTGLGIGGMLATINATAAEVANERRRNLCVSIMAIGYPIGVVLGGKIVALLLQSYDWRSVFYFGAFATAVFIPIVAWQVPESISWLCQRQPAGALERVNRTLARMGHAAVSALPALTRESRASPFADIFRRGLVRTTVLATLAYALHIATFYYIVKWVPKIVVDMGYAQSSAADVLVWTNVGGATGGAVLGLLALRLELKTLTVFVLVMSFVMVTMFGRVQGDLAEFSLVCAATGFFTNAGIVGIYAILARAFPTHVRATGTGFVVGLGRGGSVLGPIAAGFLFEGGYGLQLVSMLLGAGSFLAAVTLSLLRLRPGTAPSTHS